MIFKVLNGPAYQFLPCQSIRVRAFFCIPQTATLWFLWSWKSFHWFILLQLT